MRKLVLVKNWKKWHMNQVMILLFATIILSFLWFLHSFSNDTDITALNNELSQPTVLYDVNGKKASMISGSKHEGVAIRQVPKSMKNAVVAIEDRRFYEHGGIDYKGIFRAFFKNAVAGEVVEGGSTITQQLAKNTLLTSKRTYKRKLEEFFLAKKIEGKYSKDEILQMYFNQIYFGKGAWGLKNASQKYFGKDVKDLTISESAILAGIIKAPSALNPYDHLQEAIDRRNVVLTAMKKQGFITSEQFKKSESEKVVLKDGGGDPFWGRYPYYVDQVFEEAIKEYGLSQKKLLEGGYEIYTEMDPGMQASAEETYKNDSLFPQGNGRLVQSGAVIMDPHTGGVRALVGGRGEHTFRGYNRATQLQAQPGSSFKPVAVYAPALEEGWNITDMLKDEPMKFGTYEPKNYNHQYLGEVPMYDAVKESMNVPAVWLLNEISIKKGLDSIKRFGIPLDKEDRNLSIALGGLHRGVSPMKMAEAFSVFPNKGERIPAHLIRKIVDSDGNKIAGWKEKEVRVTTKSVTDKMNTLLLGVVEEGTGKGAQVPGYEIAGKTGSTQVPIKGINGVKDQWFVGYSPNLVGAVWVGYDKTDSKHYLTTTSSEGAARVFQQVMSEALKNTNPESFNVQHIGALMEQKRQEELLKKQLEQQQAQQNSLQQQFNGAAKKWEEKIKKEKEKLEKKVKGHGKGKGHGHGH